MLLHLQTAFAGADYFSYASFFNELQRCCNFIVA